MTFHWYLLTIFIEVQNFKEKGKLPVSSTFFSPSFFLLFKKQINGLHTQSRRLFLVEIP